MSGTRLLIIENDPDWQDDIAEILQAVGCITHIDRVSDYSSAAQHLRDNRYDLITLDLSIPDASGQETVQTGLKLLGEIRQSEGNSLAGIVVMTAFGHIDQIPDFVKSNVTRVINKLKFDLQELIVSAREAIRDSLLNQAQARIEQRYYLTLEFDENHLLNHYLTGPGRQATHPRQSEPFEARDLARRADNLNIFMLAGGVKLWRPEARSIGKSIYDQLTRARGVEGNLHSGKRLAPHAAAFHLTFSGPPAGMGVPFELMWDGNDYLVFDHLLSRRILHAGPTYSRKSERFHRFLRDLVAAQERLRVLVVGSNSDGRIPAAESEARLVAETLQEHLNTLNLPNEVVPLIGAEATYEEVKQQLEAKHYHIFHYAGHGRFDDRLAEISGLVLGNAQGGYGTLKASDLKSLGQSSNLRLVFLSCCLSARTADSPGYGDFHSVFDALTLADVPTIVGYRWTVADDPAQEFARCFYDQFLHSFCPEEALHSARTQVAMGEHGRNDETWASAILVMQNVSTR